MQGQAPSQTVYILTALPILTLPMLFLIGESAAGSIRYQVGSVCLYNEVVLSSLHVFHIPCLVTVEFSEVLNTGHCLMVKRIYCGEPVLDVPFI